MTQRVSAYGLVAFIERNKITDSAMVEVREPTSKNAAGNWQLGKMLAQYETMSKGAAASARREMKKQSSMKV